jgi:hypothetical protein
VVLAVKVLETQAHTVLIKAHSSALVAVQLVALAEAAEAVATVLVVAEAILVEELAVVEEALSTMVQTNQTLEHPIMGSAQLLLTDYKESINAN